MNRRVPRASAVVALVMAPLMVFVVPVGATAGAGIPISAGSGPTEWAYGAVKNVSVSGTTASGWTYVLSAAYGYSVILNESNPSANPFSVSVVRSMGVDLSLVACRPDCSVADHGSGSISFRAFETSYAFANFTTDGAVLEGSTSVPALALVNSSSFSNANLTERAALSTLVPLANWSTYLAASTHSTAMVTFASPLGLIPLNLSEPQNWTSQAAFTAVGLTSWSWYLGWQTLRAGSGFSGPHGGSLTASRSGNVSVMGGYLGSIPFAGVSYPVLSLDVVGPFSVREGFILIPSAGDLFGPTGLPWQSNESTVATVQIHTVDARPFVNGHLGVIASSWIFATGAINPGDAQAPGATAAAGVDPALAVASTSVPSTTVQGAPMTVSAAQQVPTCLQSGLGCPSTAGSAGSRPLLGLLAIGVVAVVVAAIVASVVVVQRRRMPPPVYPNANLYPPGATGSAAPPPGANGSGGRPPPPPEDDPLSHLW